MDQLKNVLVTGANGFIGRAITGALEDRSVNVRGAIRTRPSTSLLSCECVPVGTVDGATDWDHALDGVTDVIHLVARTHRTGKQTTRELDEYRKVNVDGTRNLAAQAATAGVRRFVFLSSVKVNGERTSLRPFTAGDTPRPVDAYGKSKLEAEHTLANVSARTSMELVVIRPPLVYGPGVAANFARLMRWVQRGIPLPFGGIRNHRSMVARANLVDLLVKVVHSDLASGRTFMVSDGRDVSTPELVRLLAKAMGSKARLLPVPPSVLKVAGTTVGRRREVDRLCNSLQVDMTETCETLGWKPVVELDDALAETARDFALGGR